MPRYEIIIYWSQADEAFIAEVSKLPACAADGKTYKEALAKVEIIIQEWIGTAKELGRPIPAPRPPRLRLTRFTCETTDQWTKKTFLSRGFTIPARAHVFAGKSGTRTKTGDRRRAIGLQSVPNFWQDARL